MNHGRDVTDECERTTDDERRVNYYRQAETFRVSRAIMTCGAGAGAHNHRAQLAGCDRRLQMQALSSEGERRAPNLRPGEARHWPIRG